MVAKIKFSTGKEIELTDQELCELYGQTRQQVFISSIQSKPWEEQPYPYKYPMTTYKSSI